MFMETRGIGTLREKLLEILEEALGAAVEAILEESGGKKITQ